MNLRALVPIVYLLTVMTPRAEACDGCTRPSEAELYEAALRVYAGRVIAVDGKTATLAVDAVWKGTVGKRQAVKTRCEKARKGARLIVMDNGGKPGKFADPCLGLLRDSARARGRVTDLGDRPRAPT
jgi:hypothetical protein